jgi:hypothetical protein
MFGNLFKKNKKEMLLTQEDFISLKNIERQAYVEEAKKLALERGKKKAVKDYIGEQKENKEGIFFGG